MLGVMNYPLALLARLLPPEEALRVDAVRYWVDPLSNLVKLKLMRLPSLCSGHTHNWNPGCVRLPGSPWLSEQWECMGFAILFAGLDAVGMASIKQQWLSTISRFQAVSTLALIISLLALLFRDQQQT